MAKVRGRLLRLSLARRMIGDFLTVSQPIPLAHGERRIDIRPLREAVSLARPRPNWLPLFFKAYASVSSARPVLRRLYVRRPWAHLYEHPQTVGSVVISRVVEGDDALLYLPISNPENRSIAELDNLLKEAREKPLQEIPAFRRQIGLSRLPYPIRRLTYGLGMDWLPRMRRALAGHLWHECAGQHGHRQPDHLGALDHHDPLHPL